VLKLPSSIAVCCVVPPLLALYALATARVSARGHAGVVCDAALAPRLQTASVDAELGVSCDTIHAKMRSFEMVGRLYRPETKSLKVACLVHSRLSPRSRLSHVCASFTHAVPALPCGLDIGDVRGVPAGELHVARGGTSALQRSVPRCRGANVTAPCLARARFARRSRT
jgi:hypothetical protein